jgi:hypothetical protein
VCHHNGGTGKEETGLLTIADEVDWMDQTAQGSFVVVAHMVVVVVVVVVFEKRKL